MRTMELKDYIKNNGKSMADAAREIGVSRQYLYFLCDGNSCGKKTALKIERWSNGNVDLMALMLPGYKNDITRR